MQVIDQRRGWYQHGVDAERGLQRVGDAPRRDWIALEQSLRQVVAQSHVTAVGEDVELPVHC